MSKYTIFYLDDEKDDLILPIKKRLESYETLLVDWLKPEGFEADINKIKADHEKYSAILLDLQLDAPQEDGNKVEYQAPPLAQQIRTLASLNTIRDIPIILCSTADKIKESFKRDFTSHDLFDWTFLKKEIDESTAKKIISIINAYREIEQSKKQFSDLLRKDINTLDERILSRFINEENPPIHEIARTIFKDIVQPTGVLINEKILAARLGIDIKKSENWAVVRDELFSPARYTGIFSTEWIRWWSDNVIEIFESYTEENLAILNAAERVESLKKVIGRDGIVAADPIKLCNSTNYWTICEVTGMPMDPFEGYKIDMKKEPKAWQDYAYVSLYALMERIAEHKGIYIHPSENIRFTIESKSL